MVVLFNSPAIHTAGLFAWIFYFLRVPILFMIQGVLCTKQGRREENIKPDHVGTADSNWETLDSTTLPCNQVWHIALYLHKLWWSEMKSIPISFTDCSIN